MNLKIKSIKRKTICVFLSGILVVTQLIFLMPNEQTFAKSSKVKTSSETVTVTNPIDKPGEFVVAKLDDLNIITIESDLVFPITTEANEGIIVKENGNVVEVKNVTRNLIAGAASTIAKIELSENVKLGQKLTISKTGFTEKEVVLGDVLASSGFEKMFYYEGSDLGNT